MRYTFLTKRAATCGSRVTLPRSVNYESNGDRWTDAETGKALTPAQVQIAKRNALEYKQRLRSIGAYKKADALDNPIYRGLGGSVDRAYSKVPIIQEWKAPDLVSQLNQRPVRQPAPQSAPQSAPQLAAKPVSRPAAKPAPAMAIRRPIVPATRSRQAMEDEANAWAYGQAQKALAETKDAYHWTTDQIHQFNMEHGLSERDEEGNIVTPEMMRQREIAMMPTTSSKAKPEGEINTVQTVRAPHVVNRKTRKPVYRKIKKRIRNATGMWNDRNGGVITFGNVSPTDVARASGNMGVGRNAPYSGRYSYRVV